MTVVDKDEALLRQLAQQEPDKGRKVRYELQVSCSAADSNRRLSAHAIMTLQADAGA